MNPGQNAPPPRTKCPRTKCPSLLQPRTKCLPDKMPPDKTLPVVPLYISQIASDIFLIVINVITAMNVFAHKPHFNGGGGVGGY